jgi:squalene-associated FAD-dependent desaturase
MRRADFMLPEDTSVARLLERERQGAAIQRFLWRPLCVSALNTLPEAASARAFLAVLRDTAGPGRAASDLLLPRADLSALFPDPARAWIEARGGTVLMGERVTAIEPCADEFGVRHTAGEGAFTHVVCALAPSHVKAFLIGISALAEAVEAIDRFSYQPIYSVYLQLPEDVRLPSPMLGFESALLQWAFDRGALCGQRGLIGLVISAEGMHQEHAHEDLAQLAHQELQQQLGLLPPPRWFRVIAEKRATFACTPALARPENRTALKNFLLAGDYTASDYPATIESAVRSGVAAARLVLDRA